MANRALATADHLLGNPGERLASKMAEAIRGTVNGTVAVAVAEGAIIGIAYVLAGVPHPLLFAVLTIAFAMVPFGAWVAFSAAALVVARLLRGWIAQGAKYERHWAFMPPKRPALPDVKDAKWARNPIDTFILARLEAEGLKPSKI